MRSGITAATSGRPPVEPNCGAVDLAGEVEAGLEAVGVVLGRPVGEDLRLEAQRPGDAAQRDPALDVGGALRGLGQPVEPEGDRRVAVGGQVVGAAEQPVHDRHAGGGLPGRGA